MPFVKLNEFIVRNILYTYPAVLLCERHWVKKKGKKKSNNELVIELHFIFKKQDLNPDKKKEKIRYIYID